MEQDSNVKQVWFFHTPKTAGRFFYANSFRVAEHEMIISGRQYGEILHGYGHLSFRPLDSGNILSFCTLRNPVARMISHWQHIYRNTGNPDMESNKKKLFDFLEKNPTSGIINYQTKFAAYNGNAYYIDIDEHQLASVADDSSFALAKRRIDRVDYIFRSEDMTHEVTRFSLKVIRNALNLEPKDEYFETVMSNIKNPYSKNLYDSLTKSEKDRLESYVKYDMDLYESANFYKGKL